MNKTIKFLVSQKEVDLRLDVFLAKNLPDLTRSNLKKLIESDQVKLNNITTSISSKKVKFKDIVNINIINRPNLDILPSKIDLEILFEDEDLLVLNKPSGMVVHPGAGNKNHTLVNALLYKYKKNLSNLNGYERPGIVHRIDKETSGLLVVAKNNYTHANLGKQFSNHTINRRYLALIWGVMRPINGVIKTLITRSKKNRQLMSTSELKGKKAITNYFTKKIFSIKDIPKISLIECELETGRTHQIRVHMSYKGNPLLGDKQYGKKNIKFKKINKEFEEKLNALDRQALHAKSLGFVHPRNSKFLNFESNLPDDFKKMLNLLEKLSD